ncbi:MAG TPA: hypothetical protein GX522_06855 [Firmicutes bacterium]|nr:hypothetical protein [Bacillota bacterium]
MVIILSMIVIIKLVTITAPFKSRVRRRTFNLFLALGMSAAMVIWVLPDAVDMMRWFAEIGENAGVALPEAFDDFPLVWVFWQAIPVLLFAVWDYNPNTEWLGGRLAIINDGSLGIRHSILVDRASGQTLLVDVDRAQMFQDKIYLTASGHYFLIDLKTMKIIAFEKARDIPQEYKKGFRSICWPLW